MSWGRVQSRRARFLVVLFLGLSGGTVAFFSYVPAAEAQGTRVGLVSALRTFKAQPKSVLSFRFEAYFYSQQISLFSVLVKNPAFSLTVDSHSLGMVRGRDVSFTPSILRHDGISSIQVVSLNITDTSTAKSIGQNPSNLITLAVEADVISGWYHEKTTILTNTSVENCSPIANQCGWIS